ATRGYRVRRGSSALPEARQTRGGGAHRPALGAGVRPWRRGHQRLEAHLRVHRPHSGVAGRGACPGDRLMPGYRRAYKTARRLYPLMVAAYHRWDDLSDAEKERYKEQAKRISRQAYAYARDAAANTPLPGRGKSGEA